MTKFFGEFEAIRWNGKNAKKVVDFCLDKTELCDIFNVSNNNLNIEPADTMRGVSISIPMNGYVVKMKISNYSNKIVCYRSEVFNLNFTERF